MEATETEGKDGCRHTGHTGHTGHTPMAVLSYSASPDTFRPNKLGEEVSHGQIRTATVNVRKKA